jgi:hypothetical protein
MNQKITRIGNESRGVLILSHSPSSLSGSLLVTFQDSWNFIKSSTKFQEGLSPFISVAFLGYEMRQLMQQQLSTRQPCSRKDTNPSLVFPFDVGMSLGSEPGAITPGDAASHEDPFHRWVLEFPWAGFFR